MPILELGCGRNPTPGAVHHDVKKHSPHVDVAHDLNRFPWPWESESFHRVMAIDVFEHLKCEVQEWVDECWRILVPGGILMFRVPDHLSKDAWTNPTHYRPFTDETFDFWDLRTHYGKNFGSWMFAESDRWWQIEQKEYRDGQLYFVMRKQK